MVNKKRNVLLIRVPEIEYKTSYKDIRNIAMSGLTIPLGVTYLAAVIKQEDKAEVFILDLYAEYYEQCINNYKNDSSDLLDILTNRIYDVIDKIRPDVVGISALFLFQHYLVKELVNKIKCRFPSIYILMGGYSTLIPDIVLKDISGVDVVFIGESEVSIIQVLDLKDMSDGKNLNKIDGIAFRSNGNIVKNKLNIPSDLQNIPYPSFDMLPLDKYKGIIGENHFPMLTSRSCPFSCSFCSSYRYSGRGLRLRTIDNLMDEIGLFHKKYNIDYMWIRDENFNVNIKHAKGFLKALIRTDSTIPWMDSNGFHVNSIDEEFLDLCKASKCQQIIFAVESGSPRVLKEIMNKNVDLGHSLKMSEYCRKIDLSLQCYFVIGNPGETKEEIMQTISFAQEMQVEHCTFSIATPFPGTKYYEIAIENGYFTNNDILNMKYMESNIETKEFTSKWLKDAQYDANIRVNFLYNRLLNGDKRHLEKACIKYGNIYKQYKFHAIARLIEGYTYIKLGNEKEGYKIFNNVIEMMKEKDINCAYKQYFDWKTPITNEYKDWLQNKMYNISPRH